MRNLSIDDLYGFEDICEIELLEFKLFHVREFLVHEIIKKYYEQTQKNYNKYIISPLLFSLCRRI